MVPINRRKVSLYEEAKNGFSSLVWQTATVFVGFIFMLLLTGGNPSGFTITITFVLGIAFVAWREQNRVVKLRKEPDGSLDATNRRIRQQKKLAPSIRLPKSAKLAQSVGSLEESELNRLKKIFDRQQATIRNTVGQGSFADLELEEKKLILAEKLALLKFTPTSQQQFEADSEQLIKYRYYIAVPVKISTDKNFVVIPFGSINSPESRFRVVYIKESDALKELDTDIALRQVNVVSNIKTRLSELKTAIIEHDNLTDNNKADALRYLEAIYKILLQQNETTIQTLPVRRLEP